MSEKQIAFFTVNCAGKIESQINSSDAEYIYIVIYTRFGSKVGVGASRN
jgi:hypothetical protein